MSNMKNIYETLEDNNENEIIELLQKKVIYEFLRNEEFEIVDNEEFEIVDIDSWD